MVNKKASIHTRTGGNPRSSSPTSAGSKFKNDSFLKVSFSGYITGTSIFLRFLTFSLRFPYVSLRFLTFSI